MMSLSIALSSYSPGFEKTPLNSVKLDVGSSYLISIDEILNVFITEHLLLHNMDSILNLAIRLSIKFITLEKCISILVCGIYHDHISWASFKLSELNDVTNYDLA